MTSAESSLPDGFAELEKYAADWALDSEASRNAKRLASSIEELRDFYAAMLTRIEALGDHLSKFRLSDMPEAERRLYYLALSLMEVAPAIEIHNAPDVPDAIEADRFLIRSP